MIYSLAKLTKKKLGSIQKLEKELGVQILAFSGYDIDVAKLSKEQLSRLKALEKELGVAAVAVKE